MRRQRPGNRRDGRAPLDLGSQRSINPQQLQPRGAETPICRREFALIEPSPIIAFVADPGASGWLLAGDKKQSRPLGGQQNLRRTRTIDPGIGEQMIYEDGMKLLSGHYRGSTGVDT